MFMTIYQVNNEFVAIINEPISNYNSGPSGSHQIHEQVHNP